MKMKPLVAAAALLLLSACSPAPEHTPAPSAPPSPSPSAPAPASPSSEAAPRMPARAAPSADPTATPTPGPTVAPGGTLATFSTPILDNTENRIVNMRLCAKALDGAVIGPGETFSFNETVGRRTAEKGYREAKVFYQDGKEDALGGGICQNSTTVYNAALIAELEIVERHEHMYELEYIELGRDATVYYGDLDLRFKNPYSYSIVLRMTAGGGEVTSSILRAENGTDGSAASPE